MPWQPRQVYPRVFPRAGSPAASAETDTRPSTATANRERTDIETSRFKAMKTREYYVSTGENATMIALIQRVSRARVEVAGATVAAAGRGILAFIGVETGDSGQTGARLLDRILSYRIFPDDGGK